MKILCLYTSSWWNAAAHYMVTMMEGLESLGHETVLCGDRDSPAFQKARDCGLRTIDMPLQSLAPRSIRKSVQIIRDICETLPVDVINCHSPQGVISAYMARTNILHPVIQVRTRCDDRPVQKHLFNKLLYQKANHGLIFPADSAYVKFQQMVTDCEDKSAIIHSGLHVQNFRNFKGVALTKADLNIPEHHTVLGHLARFSPVKGHHFLLQILKGLVQICADVTLLISGQDAQYTLRDLEQSIRDQSLGEHVKILPRQSDPRQLLKVIEIGLIPSQFSEVICRVAAEYMAYAKPLVVSEVNVLPEMVESGETGFVAGKSDKGAWINAMKQLCENPNLRKTMGGKALKRARHKFDRTAMCEKTIAAFLQFGAAKVE